jgi:uncharacterized protein YcgI (DUF1989 family)
MTERKLIVDIVLEPGTGKAIELRRGQVLRIEQTEGGQCADFNCFNLHDYKEFMHTGRTRHIEGMNPTKGSFLWSAPPRERPMLYILEDTVGTNDTLYPRCTGVLYEYQYGFAEHTNCHDIQAEAQREFGLTPDDVHDSFNFFMHTGVGANGEPFIASQKAKKGDYVEVLALIDVLAVPNVCGADVTVTSNFSLKPLRVKIFEASTADLAAPPSPPKFKNQRTPADFKVKQIKSDRELARDGTYRPEFTNVPIRIQDVPVTLTDSEYATLQAYRKIEGYGDSDEEALRFVLFSWWIDNFVPGRKHHDDPVLTAPETTTTT